MKVESTLHTAKTVVAQLNQYIAAYQDEIQGLKESEEYLRAHAAAVKKQLNAVLQATTIFRENNVSHTPYIRTCIHTYILTYIHTYLHTYIHTYIHTYT